MKKITAFILLCLLTFNWFGFRFVMGYMQQKNECSLEARLDNNSYDESQLVELRIPLHMAYQNDRTSYERCDGEMEYKGCYYKYVKRKVANDTLYLQCISNATKTKIEFAKNDFYKNTNDIAPSGNKQHNSKTVLIKKLLSDYDGNMFVFQDSYISVGLTTAYANDPHLFLNNLAVKFNGQPPDVSC